jgi:hypothetical protein
MKKLYVIRPALILFFTAFFFGRVFASPEAGEGPKLEDFAGAMVLSGAPGCLLRFEIPEEIYRRVERPDLGDIRIFDSQKVPVPFIIREAPQVSRTPPPEDAPFFIWNQGREKALPGNTDIEINTQGAVVKIKNQEPQVSAAQVYLLDLSGLSYSPVSLMYEADHKGGYFNAAVVIHSGTDLGRWRLFEKKQIIAYYGNSVAGYGALEVPPGSPRYLLLSPDEGAPPPLKIRAHFADVAVPAHIKETRVSGEKSPSRKTVRYNAGAYYPLVAIDFRLPEPDSIQVLVKNRFSENEEWVLRARETLFYYNTGETGEARRNKVLEIRSSAPFWELETAGELPFGTAPECFMRWTAGELIFLSRGNGPWTLAYGNRNYGPPEEASLNPEEESKILTATATGKGWYTPREVSGPKLPVNFRDYGQWFLWGSLIIAVLVLSILDFYRARSMR